MLRCRKSQKGNEYLLTKPRHLRNMISESEAIIGKVNYCSQLTLLRRGNGIIKIWFRNATQLLYDFIFSIISINIRAFVLIPKFQFTQKETYIPVTGKTMNHACHGRIRSISVEIVGIHSACCGPSTYSQYQDQGFGVDYVCALRCVVGEDYSSSILVVIARASV